MQAKSHIPFETSQALKALLLFSLSTGFAFSPAHAQESKTFRTAFVPYSVTYNGSDKPSECWESVDWGILVKEDKNSWFFSLPFEELERLQQKIGTAEVAVEVRFYEEPSAGSGQDGNVVSITLNGEVLYKAL